MTLNNLSTHPSQCAVTPRFRILDDPPSKEVLPSRLSDEDLVSRCVAELPNKVDAYNEIVRRFRPMIFGRCLKMLGGHADAEEVCQDVLLQIFRKIHQFEGRSTFKTWLFRIVFNMCMTRRRNLARRRERQDEFADQVNILANADAADIGIDDLCEHVRKALSKMEPEKRDIVSLRFVKGLSLQEIAEVREMKLSATKMRLYRALGEFKEAYGDTRKIDSKMLFQGF